MRTRITPSLVALLVISSAFVPSASASEVRLIEIDGAIGPASADYFVRTLHKAERDNVELFLLQLDTPGGLDQSMRDMIKAILASTIPVATYVAPNGSRAASAGTYILYSIHTVG